MRQPGLALPATPSGAALSFVVAALLCAVSALPTKAQFTGFSAPQPTSSLPFTAQACTGSEQTAIVANFAQTEHFLTVTTSGVLAFRATVKGSHDGVTFNDISDVATASGSTVMGQGYYPVTEISVTCATAAGTFTVKYSGEATAPSVQIGAQQSAQLDKTFATGVSAGSNFTSQTLRAPFGTSGGGIYFSYSATGPSGSILNVGCSTLSIPAAASVASYPLATPTATQFFTVPLLPCDFITLVYTSGGASAATFTISYVFNNQTITGGDPCQGATAAKVGVSISIGSATTTQLVAPLTGHIVYACGYQFTAAVGTGATYQFTTGTGGTCGTGTITQTGAMIGGSPIDSGGGGYTIFKSGSGQGLCMVTAGTSPSAQGLVTVIQQ
jgi:hypothetical protein